MSACRCGTARGGASPRLLAVSRSGLCHRYQRVGIQVPISDGVGPLRRRATREVGVLEPLPPTRVGGSLLEKGEPRRPAAALAGLTVLRGRRSLRDGSASAEL